MYTHNQLPILITIILFISFYIPTSHSQPDYNCSHLYSCGQNIQGIGYPFSGGDRHPACGLHGFELHCQDADNTTTIEIDSQTFRVLSIDQIPRTITLARNDLLDDVCPQEFVNTALNYTMFDYTRETVRFLNFFYNCPSFEIAPRNSISCSILDGRERNRTETGFYLDESFWSSAEGRRLQPCRTNITVAVNQTAFVELWEREEISVRELLEEGFQVEYRYNVGACLACQNLGGLCWYGTNTSTPSCICHDGIRSNCSTLGPGFCYEGKKRALVYEFMCNGSLEKFIYHNIPTEDAQHLRLEKLYEIAVGISRGLEYLHRGCSTPILHFDIKPHNILLDEDFCPKISDFGLAKLHSRKESIISMREARGTIGYIAPEVYSRSFGGVSHKSDVYSYGMMVLEMVGGRKNIDVKVMESSKIYFPQWIYKQVELDNDVIQLQEGPMSMVENEIARKMIIVGLWCIQTNPSQRPSMDKVIEMLEGSMEALDIPPNPFFSSPPLSPMTSSTGHHNEKYIP